MTVCSEGRGNGRDGAWDMWDGYSTTASIGILSLTEYMQYRGKFGLYLNNYQSKKEAIDNGWVGWNGDSGFWLRTAGDVTDAGHAALISTQYGWWREATQSGSGDEDIVGGLSNADPAATDFWVRPTFNLSKDFFSNVKLDVDAMGQRIKDEIYATCSAADLAKIYSKEELEKIHPALAWPFTIQNLTIDYRDGCTISLDVRRNQATEEAMLFAGAYEGNTLIDIYSKELTLDAGQIQPVAFSFSNVDSEADIRVYVLGKDSLQPLAEVQDRSQGIIYPPSSGEGDDETVTLALPETLYAVSEKEANLYFDQVCLCSDLRDFQIDVECTRGIQQEERWTYTPSGTESFQLTLKLYRDGDRQVASGQTTVVVTEEGAAGTILAIGDGLTVNGYVPALAERLSDTEATLIGTKGSGSVLCEAAEGWSAAGLLAGTDGSPFYKSGSFDFGAYLTDNGLDTPDTVLLALGAEDIKQGRSAAEIKADMASIISAIQADSPDTKIGIILLPETAGELEERFLQMNMAMISLADALGNNVFVIPASCNIDTVHEATLGTAAFQQWADAVLGSLNQL